MMASDSDVNESTVRPILARRGAIKAAVAIVCGSVAIIGAGLVLQTRDHPSKRDFGKGIVTLAETKECKSNSTSCECFVSRDANFCSTCPGVNCGTCQEYCYKNPVVLQEGPCSQDTTSCACFRHRDSNFCGTCPDCGECSEYCAQDWQWLGSGSCNWYMEYRQLGLYQDLGLDVPACIAKCEAETARECHTVAIHTWMEGSELHGDCATYWEPNPGQPNCANNTNSDHHYWRPPQ